MLDTHMAMIVFANVNLDSWVCTKKINKLRTLLIFYGSGSMCSHAKRKHKTTLFLSDF